MPLISTDASVRIARSPGSGSHPPALKRIWLALPAMLTMATGALAAERPTNPAHWPALKEVYRHHFMIGSTNLSAANFAAGVVPGEDSVPAMTVKHFNAVTPSNAMKPEFWMLSAANTRAIREFSVRLWISANSGTTKKPENRPMPARRRVRASRMVVRW